MRLLQSSSVELKDFSANQIPPYAILSHTWGEDEVLFTDIQEGKAEEKAGYEKLRQSCKRTVEDGYEYVWVDTCCIDKRSSAELSEAINSMFNWYERAGVCYAYLVDVSDVDCEGPISEFARSRWFKRGWTLQELIAPANLIFMSRDWIEIGTKSSLRVLLAEITGIDEGILAGQLGPDTASVAQRMSWASDRKTTRKEDTAYCLMGIFGVNMPLLYGEEDKAFQRLQEEIIRHSDDHSLFAWTEPSAAASDMHGILAKSPAAFTSSREIVPHHVSHPVSTIAPYSMTNRGLRIELRLTYVPHADSYLAALNCTSQQRNAKLDGSFCIYLKEVQNEKDQLARVRAGSWIQIRVTAALTEDPMTVFIRQNLSFHDLNDTRNFFQIRNMKSEGNESLRHKLIRVYTPPKKIWPSTIQKAIKQQDIEFSKGDNRLAGAILFEDAEGTNAAVLLGTMNSDQVGFEMCFLSTDDLQDLEAVSSRFNPSSEGNQNNLLLGDRSYRVTIVGVEKYPGVKKWILDISIHSILRASNSNYQLLKNLLW